MIQKSNNLPVGIFKNPSRSEKLNFSDRSVFPPLFPANFSARHARPGMPRGWHSHWINFPLATRILLTFLGIYVTVYLKYDLWKFNRVRRTKRRRASAPNTHLFRKSRLWWLKKSIATTGQRSTVVWNHLCSPFSQCSVTPPSHVSLCISQRKTWTTSRPRSTWTTLSFFNIDSPIMNSTPASQRFMTSMPSHTHSYHSTFLRRSKQYPGVLTHPGFFHAHMHPSGTVNYAEEIVGGNSDWDFRYSKSISLFRPVGFFLKPVRMAI